MKMDIDERGKETNLSSRSELRFEQRTEMNSGLECGWNRETETRGEE